MEIRQNLSILVTSLMLVVACSENTETQTTTPNPTGKNSETTVVSSAQSNPNLPTLRVMTDDTYPPFSTKNKNGQIEGLDVDLFTAVARNQGYNVQFVPHAWDGIFKTLQEDQADVIVSAVSITDESEAAADLSDSYYKTPYRIAKLSSSQFDLKDWAMQPKIAISSSEDSEVDLPERYKVKKEQLVILDSVFLAIQAMARGEANVVVADSTVLQYYMASPTFVDNQIKFDSFDLPAGRGSTLVYAVKKGNKELLNKINVGLKNVKASGEYEQILKKWHQTLPADAVVNQSK